MTYKFKQKMRQIGVAFSILIMSNSEIQEGNLDNIFANISETYQEWGTPEFGNYLHEVYNNLPEYLREFLKDNSMHIVITQNNDDIEKIYQQMYPRKTDIDPMSGLTIADKLITFVEGCSHDDIIDSLSSFYSNLDKNECNKLNLKLLMLHQIGHLIDVQLNISNNNVFLNSSFQELKDFYIILFTSIGDNSVKKRNFSLNEWFPSAYAFYMTWPQFLNHYCPNTYGYIDKINNSMIDKSYSLKR